jgi:hypothetical protein
MARASSVRKKFLIVVVVIFIIFCGGAAQRGNSWLKGSETATKDSPKAKQGSSLPPSPDLNTNASSESNLADGGSPRQTDTKSDSSSLPKIWMMWASEWENAPLICQLCAMSWEKNNPDFEVVKLDENSVKEWLPELFAPDSDDIWLTARDPDGSYTVSLVKQTDYIRLKLLEKYGGVWADATLMATGSLSEFMRKHPGSEEFLVLDRRNSGNWPMMCDPFSNQELEWSNWFFIYYPYAHLHELRIKDQRMREASEALKVRILQEIAEEEKVMYFAMHYAVQGVPHWKDIWITMPSISAGYPHTVEFGMGFFKSIHGEDGAKSKQILETALTKFPGQKLSHKLVSDLELAQLAARDLLQETLLGVLLEMAFDGDSLDMANRFIREKAVSENKNDKFLEDDFAKDGQANSDDFLEDLAEAAQIKQQANYDNWPFLKNVPWFKMGQSSWRPGSKLWLSKRGRRLVFINA